MVNNNATNSNSILSSSTTQRTTSHKEETTVVPVTQLEEIVQEKDESQHEAMQIYYQNARGLNTHLTIFHDNVATCNYTIIIIAETWLKDNIEAAEVVLSTIFNLHRADRTPEYKSNGGGVLIAVRKRFNISSL